MWLKTGEFKYSMENTVKEIKWGQEPNVGKWRDKMSVGKAYKVIDGNANTLIDCRIYYGSGMTVRCAIWINAYRGQITTEGTYTRGVGMASGCGYDKYSAVVQSALYSAGVFLKKDIGGVGETATRGALEAIAKKILGKGKRFIIVESHN